MSNFLPTSLKECLSPDEERNDTRRARRTRTSHRHHEVAGTGPAPT